MNDVIDWLFRPSEQIWNNKFVDPNERSLCLGRVQKCDKPFVEEFLEKLKEVNELIFSIMNNLIFFKAILVITCSNNILRQFIIWKKAERRAK